MVTSEILWLVGALLVMALGVVGCVLPAIPGTPLIFAAAVLHRVIVGPAGPDTWVLVTLGLLMMISLAADYLASLYGARTLGATRRGMAGAVAGGLVGLFFGPLGILVGPFVGAFALEMTGGREWQESARAGVGATLGILVGAVGKLACAVAMVLLFVVNVVWKALNTGV